MGGACELGIESTIIDATDFSTCAILRHGHITQQDLQNALGSSIKVLDTPLKKRQVSGTLKKHYAPSKPAFLFSTEVELQSLKERFQTLSVLRYSASQANMPSSPNLYSKELYHQLRMADCASTEAIAIEAPPATSDWLAISDRLTRACVCYDKGDEQ